MAKFNIPTSQKIIPAPVPAEEKVPQPVALEQQAEHFVSAAQVTDPDALPRPADGKCWKKSERAVYPLSLSPPQKQALALVADMQRKTQHEYLLDVIEAALLADLRKYAEFDIGGAWALDARAALEYLQRWGDLAVGRYRQGRSMG